MGEVNNEVQFETLNGFITVARHRSPMGLNYSIYNVSGGVTRGQLRLREAELEQLRDAIDKVLRCPK